MHVVLAQSLPPLSSERTEEGRPILITIRPTADRTRIKLIKYMRDTSYVVYLTVGQTYLGGRGRGVQCTVLGSVGVVKEIHAKRRVKRRYGGRKVLLERSRWAGGECVSLSGLYHSPTPTWYLHSIVLSLGPSRLYGPTILHAPLVFLFLSFLHPYSFLSAYPLSFLLLPSVTRVSFPLLQSSNLISIFPSPRSPL